MKNCFLSYDYTSKIFDVFGGKTRKAKVIHTFSLDSNYSYKITNQEIYKCSLRIIAYYQTNGYTVYFDEFIANILETFEPIFKQKRNINQERSLVQTTVIQLD